MKIAGDSPSLSEFRLGHRDGVVLATSVIRSENGRLRTMNLGFYVQMAKVTSITAGKSLKRTLREKYWQG